MGHAQDAGVCAAPLAGWVESFPANGASNVSINAPIHVRYTNGFLAVNRVSITLANIETGAAVAATTEAVADELFVIPTTPLTAATRYQVTASGGVEGPLSFAFATNLRDADAEAPDLGAGLDDLTLSTDTNTDPCDSEFRYRVGVQFRPAANESSAVDVEYLLYVVRGDGIAGPTLRARARTGSPDLVVMSFGLSDREAHAPLCFSVVAIDGAMNVSTATPASCFQPVEGLAFAPLCSVPGAIPHTPPSPTMWGILLCICIVVAPSARRRLRQQRGEL